VGIGNLGDGDAIGDSTGGGSDVIPTATRLSSSIELWKRFCVDTVTGPVTWRSDNF